MPGSPSVPASAAPGGEPALPAAAAGADGCAIIDSVRLSRLRWRCRRGMLENDLVLTRFLDARGGHVTPDEEAMLSCLLDLSDNELWDVLSGRAEADDPAVRPLVQVLRAAE